MNNAEDDVIVAIGTNDTIKPEFDGHLALSKYLYCSKEWTLEGDIDYRRFYRHWTGTLIGIYRNPSKQEAYNFTLGMRQIIESIANTEERTIANVEADLKTWGWKPLPQPSTMGQT